MTDLRNSGCSERRGDRRFKQIQCVSSSLDSGRIKWIVTRRPGLQAVHRSRLWLAAVVLTCGILAPNSSGRPVTLQEAVDLALQNNERVKQYQERVTQKRYDDREATGNFLPSISFQGSYTHLNDPLEIDLDPIRQAVTQLEAGDQVEFANTYRQLQGGSELTSEERAQLFSQFQGGLNAALPPFVETLKEQNYPSASLVGVQPLFMGGKLIAAKRAASAERRASEADNVRVRNDVIGEAIVNYLRIVLLTEVIKTRKDVLKGMRHHSADAQRLYDEGLIARNDLLRAKVAVADAERHVFDEQNRLEQAMISLRHTLGLSAADSIEVCDDLAYKPVTDSLGEFQTAAEADQPILQMVAEKRKMAAQKYAVERSDYLPHVVGYGRYEMYQDDLSALEPQWAVGIQVSLNVFDGIKRHSRLQSARHLKKEVEYIEAHTKRQIDLLVQKSYCDMRNYEKRYQTLAASIELAEENQRLNERRFQSGMGTSLEVIDATLSLERSEVERLLSLFEYYQALANLNVAVGQPEKLIDLWTVRMN